MNQKKAIKIAIDCIRKEMKKIVFDANSSLRGTQIPHHLKCYERYIEMTETIQILEDIKQGVSL